jgi:antitoxin HicB
MEPYLALFEPDLKAGGYVVMFPDFGYGVTQGETEEEAFEMAQDLLMLTIGDYVRESKPLPAPRRHRGSKFQPVRLSALQAAKVDLYAAFLESGLTKAEFARRAGIQKTHVERLFSLRHHSRLDQIESSFAALGKRLHIEARERGLRSVFNSRAGLVSPRRP